MHMTVRTIWIAVTIVFILSVMGVSLWLFEILTVKQWNSLDWLRGQLYSPYISALLAVLSFMVPFLLMKQVATKKVVLSLAILYIVNIICYEAGKRLCYALYCKFCFWTKSDIVFLFSIAFTLFAFLGIAYWFVANKWIRKTRKINILLITLLAGLVIPLSLVAIQVNTGFGSQTGWVDAVKMGYPMFWMILLLGVSGIVIARQRTLRPALTD